jgi:hypothetical protein
MSEREKLTFWQRLGVREIRRAAGKKPGEPLTAEDWAAAYEAEKGIVPRTRTRRSAPPASRPRRRAG